ncbi:MULTISPECIES: hypothetical protein [unclassified Undibacterium]|uniref:hypothetical protein n=1 Tax=unclassified Undibacterium TaxID=2630295 RepID=UPI002AC8BD9C|nr:MULTISPECIES: hypothetical protein [unclassified Undibacterium]MEB0137680.1 hypothetical protein [Undibacterium sp. CCC2.1]MEB0172668.1 hypothetical protein [Undibacterium sp. CCC1.1]MEB0177601.1 hypothetical protein [Undibacterium sp. CCC3.4]MEB0215463.1 hypothetical protein [Undibacterium sp. 5I2]WPX42254.1 hypothetical protein RHM61_12715 [Undibacterium sp. CCC3.4]
MEKPIDDPSKPIAIGGALIFLDGDTRNPDVSCVFADSVVVLNDTLRIHNGWMDMIDFLGMLWLMNRQADSVNLLKEALAAIADRLASVQTIGE